MTLLERLAEHAVAFGPDRLTAKAVRQAKACILDTVGVTLAGIPEPCTQILLATPGIAEAPGPALILGTHRRTSLLDAALVNGTASHALDFDDFSGALGGHHSVPLVPSLLALGESRGSSGRDLILAYVLGVEVMTRLARAVNFHHYDKGWHPTTTLGIFGTAAASSRMLGLDAPRMATALAIAASLASGIKANFGTMVKPLHVGQCARNGLLAALLAEGGYDASHDALEHHQGFLNVFNGPGTFDSAKLFEGWAEPLEIEADTIGLKQFPCCGSTHPAIMMALALAAEEKVRADDVAGIEIMPHVRRLRHTDTPRPETALEAKFSVQYAVARALKDRSVRLRHFEGEAHADPAIRRLLDVTQARPHPDMPEDGRAQWGAEVIVTLSDGRRLSRRVDDMVGRGGDNPMSGDEMWDKFDDCARRVLPRDRIAPLFEALDTLETAPSISLSTRLMEVEGFASQSTTTKVVFARRGEHQSMETTWVP